MHGHHHSLTDCPCFGSTGVLGAKKSCSLCAEISCKVHERKHRCAYYMCFKSTMVLAVENPAEYFMKVLIKYTGDNTPLLPAHASKHGCAPSFGLKISKSWKLHT